MEKNMPPANEWLLDTVGAGKYLSLSKFTLEKLRVAGGGPRYAKLGGAVRYRRSDLDEWVAGNLVRSTGEGSSD